MLKVLPILRRDSWIMLMKLGKKAKTWRTSSSIRARSKGLAKTQLAVQLLLFPSLPPICPLPIKNWTVVLIFINLRSSKIMCIPGVPIPGPVMFFIFGFPEYDSNIKKYEGVKLHCDRCNNDSMEAIRHRRFFSMFWIPFLPLHFSKRIKCSICGSFRDVSKSEIDQLFKR